VIGSWLHGYLSCSDATPQLLRFSTASVLGRVLEGASSLSTLPPQTGVACAATNPRRIGCHRPCPVVTSDSYNILKGGHDR
jgi:hypothetical protein